MPLSEGLEPLRFEQLFARAYRNLEPLDLEPGPRFNVVSGDNGQGKSNLLEALAYVGSLRSFRGAPGDELVQRGRDTATLAAKVSGPPAPHTLKVRLHRSGAGKGRELALDDKRPRSIATWLGVCPVVLFHPGDLELAQGGPDARRALLDRVLEEMDPTYGATLTEYVRALRSRNRLLKQEVTDRRSILAYDPILASAGAVLARARTELVREIAPVTTRTFAEILGEDVPLDVRYAPRVAASEDAMRDALARSLEKDLARGFTAEGPHADDVALEVHARGARHHASQGQQRMIVLALKVAELDVLAKRIGRVPPLLLDDVSSELDRTRNRRFFELLARIGGQVFLTTTHPEFILLDEGRTDWRVDAGRVVRA